MTRRINKILVANRGEIAVRIIQACQELHISTVAVYSDSDRQASHVRMADEAVFCGPSLASESYLNIDRLMSIAARTHVDAMHPGYGFLSENAALAHRCREADIVFIGPTPEAMSAVGQKTEARHLAELLGIPTLAGSTALELGAHATNIAAHIGLPVVVKAAGGGGGRGMKVVQSLSELDGAIESARRESETYFNDSSVYIERYLESPRHVEVQLMGDASGVATVVGTRDCSIQRAYQKLIEEAPALLTDELNSKVTSAAASIANAVSYSGAGTVEFLIDGENFYFLEMNTRIQVEHPVTEMTTGTDLIKAQIAVAEGLPIPFIVNDHATRGHAIECRINAEDPGAQFRPSPGRITTYQPPTGPGIRVDSAAFAGSIVSEHYDSLVAKVIAWGHSREEARVRMIRALQQFVIEGIATTKQFHLIALQNDRFMQGAVTTAFVNSLDLTAIPVFEPVVIKEELAGMGKRGQSKSYVIDVNGKQFSVQVAETAPQPGLRKGQPQQKRSSTHASDSVVRSPLHGTVLSIQCSRGQQIVKGSVIATVEAMKMENDIVATTDGLVTEVHVSVGDSVNAGAPIASVVASQ